MAPRTKETGRKAGCIEETGRKAGAQRRLAARCTQTADDTHALIPITIINANLVSVIAWDILLTIYEYNVCNS